MVSRADFYIQNLGLVLEEPDDTSYVVVMQDFFLNVFRQHS